MQGFIAQKTRSRTDPAVDTVQAVALILKHGWRDAFCPLQKMTLTAICASLTLFCSVLSAVAPYIQRQSLRAIKSLMKTKVSQNTNPHNED